MLPQSIQLVTLLQTAGKEGMLVEGAMICQGPPA